MNGPESVWGSKWSILLKRPQWDETGFSLGPGGSLIIIIQGILSCHISQRLFPLHTNSATFPRWKLLLPSLFIFPTVAPPSSGAPVPDLGALHSPASETGGGACPGRKGTLAW